jgi:methionyl-tRNA formyltransferase
MGTGAFAEKHFKALLESEKHNICGLVTAEDVRRGRGMKLQPPEIKVIAESKKIKVLQPSFLKENVDFMNSLEELNPDIIVVASYGKYIPTQIWNMPKHKAINIHPSLLPKLRGAAPLQWALFDGMDKTGVSIMYIASGMDSGDVILQKELPISSEDNYGTLSEKAANLGAKLLLEALDLIDEGKVDAKKQVETEVTEAPKYDKHMSEMHWNHFPKEKAINYLRALTPSTGLFTFYKWQKIKIWNIDVFEYDDLPELKAKINEKTRNGEILKVDYKSGIYVKSSNGIILLKEVQLENAKRMAISEFLIGNMIEEGVILR